MRRARVQAGVALVPSARTVGTRLRLTGDERELLGAVGGLLSLARAWDLSAAVAGCRRTCATRLWLPASVRVRAAPGRPAPRTTRWPKRMWTACTGTGRSCAGRPVRIPLELDGLPAKARDARLREATTALLEYAKTTGAAAIACEQLGSRTEKTREEHGRRKSFRKLISGFPTSRSASAWWPWLPARASPSSPSTLPPPPGSVEATGDGSSPEDPPPLPPPTSTALRGRHQLSSPPMMVRRWRSADAAWRTAWEPIPRPAARRWAGRRSPAAHPTGEASQPSPGRPARKDGSHSPRLRCATRDCAPRRRAPPSSVGHHVPAAVPRPLRHPPRACDGVDPVKDTIGGGQQREDEGRSRPATG